jgi:hypothetical protein
VSVALLVLAKSPAPGRSKTRLCPPCSFDQAACLAEVALLDTLEAVEAARTPGRRVLVLDGEPGPWRRPGWDVLAQRGRGLDERLANAFADAGGPGLLVGMDTPQITPALLRASVDTLCDRGAVLGRAEDGGYWAIGLREPDPAVFLGVPMSTASTFRAQRRRLRSLGIGCEELPPLRDVDTIDDAWAVAARAPTSRFARTLDAIGSSIRPAGAIA